MKKIAQVMLGMITGIILTTVFLGIGFFRNALANQSQFSSSLTPVPKSNESGAVAPARFLVGNDETPPSAFLMNVQSPNVLPTPIPGETLVYFATADSDATATVLYLYNTDAVAHTVALRGYSSTGVLGYSLNIDVAAGGFIRLTSDSVAAAPPPSWATPAPIVTNFTDFTYYASLSLPKGVKVEGYVLFNPGTGVVDPRLDQGATPIRFSTDPAAVFLPSVQSVP